MSKQYPLIDDDFEDNRTPREVAEQLVNWLSDQKHGSEHILHPSVCVDFAGRTRFINAIARIIEDGTVYCHGCSEAGGADRAIYHSPPECKR